MNDPFDVHIHNIDRQRIKALALPKMWEAFFGEEPFTPGNKLGLLMAIARGRLKKITREEFDNIFGPGIDEGFDNLVKHLPEHQADIRRYMAKTKVICDAACA